MAKVSVDREGAIVTIALRDGGKTATLAVSARAAGALEALVARAVAADDDWDGECSLEGSLETTEDRK